MPINIEGGLPAYEVLSRENIFCMTSGRALRQDIRPMKILILNLMPKKIETEIHILRMLANTPLQVHVEFLRIDDVPSSHTPIEHMERFYKDFDEIRDARYDGLIITGAPLGKVPFDEVRFWDALKDIMDWSLDHVTSTMFLCWAVQAAMYHLYGIDKRVLPKKISGVYRHELIKPFSPIVRGFDDAFDAPHSRYAEVPADAIMAHPELDIVASSEVAGPYIILREDGRQLFITGHSEYEPTCLRDEYERDLAAGLDPEIPENYFPGDDPSKPPIITWKSHGNLLFQNWLNYYVYQLTPYDESLVGTTVDEPRMALV